MKREGIESQKGQLEREKGKWILVLCNELNVKRGS